MKSKEILSEAHRKEIYDFAIEMGRKAEIDKTMASVCLFKQREALESAEAENERLIKGIEELKMHLLDTLEEADYPYAFELIDNLLNPNL